ncbi:MAG: hypothetical protein ACR2PH_07460 [Desulfobulbia bacterium]
MNYIHNLQNEFVERVSNTLWTATDVIKNGEEPIQVVEMLEKIARELDTMKVMYEIDLENEDPIL